ncbi:MAG: DUF2971 domain-containing protein [Desulfobacteraceae bacterium]|nr:DUF2971 domain-containing protein [Desulfobacteraceae bacterium]
MIRPTALNNGNKFIGIVKVTYEKNSLTNWFIDFAKKLPIESDSLGVELAKNYLAAKSPDWEYENEVRIIKSKPGSLKIEKDYMKQIFFGLNTPDSDIDLIKNIIDHYNHEVDLYRIVRTDSDFGITEKKI